MVQHSTGCTCCNCSDKQRPVPSTHKTMKPDIDSSNLPSIAKRKLASKKYTKKRTKNSASHVSFPTKITDGETNGSNTHKNMKPGSDSSNLPSVARRKQKLKKYTKKRTKTSLSQVSFSTKISDGSSTKPKVFSEIPNTMRKAGGKVTCCFVQSAPEKLQTNSETSLGKLKHKQSWKKRKLKFRQQKYAKKKKVKIQGDHDSVEVKFPTKLKAFSSNWSKFQEVGSYSQYCNLLENQICNTC